MLRRLSAIYFVFICFISGSEKQQGYLNGYSPVILNNTISLQERTSFSFRTCSSGLLLYQKGKNGDFLSLDLKESGQIEFKWKINGQEQTIFGGTKLNNNHWHNVDLIHNVGTLTLYIDFESYIVANNTYHSNIFKINLKDDIPNLYVGYNFSGCILQGINILLNSSTNGNLVQWDICPLPDKEDCSGYGTACFNEPCLNNGICVNTLEDNRGYTCQCTQRYKGGNCEYDDGPLCSFAFCQNGGFCREDKLGNYSKCICSPKYTGLRCETRIEHNFCDSQPCRNNGSCNINQSENGYVCTCTEGFTGINCDTNINECESNPCKNNGVCMDKNNGYVCDCNGTGYRGENCEININECEEINPCPSGSTCFDRYGDFVCQCSHGFQGKYCTNEINECLSSPCLNGGSCIDYLDRYECQCVQGFNGINCEINANCENGNCQTNSTCVNEGGNYYCVCNPGYSGQYPNCFKIDHVECSVNSCQNGGRCITGSGICECLQGYTGPLCETEINECLSNPCSTNRSIKCNDLVNDYHCECLPGWKGKNCDEYISECVSQPCLHGNCIDVPNNYSCSCHPGYTGLQCEININECESNPCQNGGVCEDDINDFKCICLPTYMGKFCSEIFNACASAPCMNDGICHTRMPSTDFSCSCQEGFTGSHCETNINECEGVNCPFGQECVDLINSYECRCPVGFTGPDCSTNINECLSNPCINGTCQDNIGSYTCICPNGVTGKNCDVDIDECSLLPCRNGICQNSFGSYHCYCTPGFTGDQCHIEFNECLSIPCQNNGTCWDDINDYRCACIPGFTGRHCEMDIDECQNQPCLHGGTCQDRINTYKCKCLLGFTGVNCEINIDECESSPCVNGQCIDLINEFSCNCSETGYTGSLCEINIDDCESSPCQHGATCIDEIKNYHCNCYPGFNGRNCEIDFPDCDPNPCYNSALCLENSNQTLYETNYLGFFSGFSYENASGYRCFCPQGFTGQNCEVDINECEDNKCVNGTCIDEVNGYHCQCLPGFEGMYCDVEINECLKFSPCKNDAVCTDLIADYKCECPSRYGGKNCDIELLGCINNKCENDAKCIAYLDDNNNHKYLCECPLGFYGKYCNIITTVSFESLQQFSTVARANIPTYWKLPVTVNDTMSYNLTFQFRTTLPTGLLAKVSTDHASYIVYLNNGAIQLDIYNNTHYFNSLFIANMYINDAKWKNVTVSLTPSVIIFNVNDDEEQLAFKNSLNFHSIILGGQMPGIIQPPNNSSDIPNFIGCIREVKLNDRIFIPDDKSYDLSGGKIGCNRSKQCYEDTCENNGQCSDKWNVYFCKCQRSFFGVRCKYSYTPVTFSPNNSHGCASLQINENDTKSMEYQVNVSLIFRTRKDNGLLFHLGSSQSNSSYFITNSLDETQNSYLEAFLKSSKLHITLKVKGISSKNIITIPRKFDDGEYYLLQIVRNSSALVAYINDTQSGEVVSINETARLEANILYIGSYSNCRRQKREVFDTTNDLTTIHSRDNGFSIYSGTNTGFFKGIISDMRVNEKVVVFFDLPTNSSDTVGFPETLGKVHMENVIKGVISDEPCEFIYPCENGGTCKDIWNAYQCVCTEDFRGENCSERQPCSLNETQCPSGSRCHNMNEGYQCVSSVAFRENTFIHLKPKDLKSIDNITFLYRTLDGGNLMNINYFNDNLSISILNNSLLLQWLTFDNEVVNISESYDNISDGNWHKMTVTFKDKNISLLIDTNFTLEIKNDYGNKMFNDIILGSLLNNDGFRGCMDEVRLNNLLLPVFKTKEYPNNESNFQIINNKNEHIGCILCWEDECKHNTSCENEIESFECNCRKGYEGRYCQDDECDKKPCKNDGVCYHTYDDGIKCNCSCDYTGDRCETKVDHCQSNPCQNGGICYNVKCEFQCNCTEDYEGTKCEVPKIKDCRSNPCLNGGTCINTDPEKSSVMFICNCPLNYTGLKCETERDFCESSPCHNGGTCHSELSLADFSCICPSGYSGKMCENEINECESNPCQNGRCEDRIGMYYCHCYYGYKGVHCENRIVKCNEKQDLCNNGSCEDQNESYRCLCKNGFHGNHCSLVDMCKEKSPCDANERCIPIGNEDKNYSAYECKCEDGPCTGAEVDWAIVVGITVGCAFLLCILIAIIMFLRVAKKKRATRGTYSPSRQEMYGSRVEMNHVMKPPPEERLI
ncbi:protein crumbs-like [Centruroides sculpturatus]|uniref:protein crumbs-like n=1 Tax=Centruroides sculpturatus TaxID=218467 RepID=UPI000C6CF89F|nr:protein crumbs-like [Centruroides sculpturatus]